MPTFALRTHKLAIERLKGIRGLDEISFEDKPLTGIFGPNGIGKSTILQALASAYSAPRGCTAAHYKRFFPPMVADIWNGTKFMIEHTYTTGEVSATGTVEYRKGTIHSNWQPTPKKRPERHVTFVGIKTCLPDVERYSSHDLSRAGSTPRTEQIDNKVREFAGAILNCNYSAIATLHLRGSYRARNYFSLTRADIGGTEYPSVVMGAGEQRLLRLLYAVETTRKNGLILVDELDLLMHGDALKKLVVHLAKRCAEREQQLIFTSHREELLALKDHVNIRHLWPLDGKHRCYPETDPDSLHRLTGNRIRPLEIFVEDDVAEAIASHVAGELGMSRHVQIIRFGAATNCFTMVAGLLMKGENCHNSLFVLDGDVYLAAEDRESQIKRACSGDDARAIARRADMATRIKDFVLPAGMKPELYLHSLICALPAADLTPPELEIQKVAKEIVHPPDKHGFIYFLVTTLGDDRAVQLARVIPLAAKHPDWANYTKPVRDWFTARKLALDLP
jgi:energy-coupling factor transporter ATP-binding protein EcfA2